MSQRSQEIIRRIKDASEKAKNPNLNRNQVEAERQKVMKTFKEFVESVFAPGETSYGDPKYQERLAKKREEENKKKKAEQKSKHDELYKERKHGRGIRATKDGIKGWIKNKIFTPGDW